MLLKHTNISLTNDKQDKEFLIKEGERRSGIELHTNKNIFLIDSLATKEKFNGKTDEKISLVDRWG